MYMLAQLCKLIAKTLLHCPTICRANFVCGQANGHYLNKKLTIDVYTGQQIQQKEVNNEQDKVTSHFGGYRTGTGDNRNSAGGSLIVGIIPQVQNMVLSQGAK